MRVDKTCAMRGARGGAERSAHLEVEECGDPGGAFNLVRRAEPVRRAPDLGFGRIVASETEAPIILVNLA